MNDTAKRKLIRFLNGFDRTSAKASPNKGWNARTVTRDEPAWRREADDEIERLSGKDLNRELLRQILYTLPVALFLLAVLAAAVWVIVVT